MIIKLVQDELVNILGSENQPLNIVSSQITKILFCGLARIWKNNLSCKTCEAFSNLLQRKKFYLSSVDIYRPAAQEQLKILAEQALKLIFLIII